MANTKDWFFYKKIIHLSIYTVLGIIGLYFIYNMVDYFFMTTFQETRLQYSDQKVLYTSEAGSDPGAIDKNKWKKPHGDKGWNAPILSDKYVHPLVALSIAMILVIAIIGGIVVFRQTSKLP
ncbi:MAG: hypothetical protein B6226_06150 [Candidatus Cloacimonetes bacterium 4572_65]|nr:MAG: hypothetical protein B6226_06150 [Candidatus Cloacimonetes bacterium 4572_65]